MLNAPEAAAGEIGRARCVIHFFWLLAADKIHGNGIYTMPDVFLS